MLCEVVMVGTSQSSRDGFLLCKELDVLGLCSVSRRLCTKQPPRATFCPPALLLVQAAVTNKDLFLFCMVWGGDRQSCHCCGQVFKMSWVKDNLCPGRAPEGQVVYSKRSLTLVQSDAFESAFLQRHSAACSRGCYHVAHTENRHCSGLGNTRCNRFLCCRFFFLYLMFNVVPTVESLCSILKT